MTFCVNKNLLDKFMGALRSGEVKPEQLAEMSSADRRAVMAKYFGEANAFKANALFESKLLLKNQQRGIVNWAKQLTGIKPEVKRDILSRVERMDEVLTPETEQAFLADLAAQRLGITVSMEEAGVIADLAATVSEKKAGISEGSPIMSKERMEYGRALVKFGDFVSDLKNEAKRMTLSDVKRNPGQAILKGIEGTAGLAKSLVASLDNSVIGRQGLKVLFTHPGVWLKNSANTFVDIAKTFGGKEAKSEVLADVLSRPNAINGLYAREKLAIGNIEEQFPTTMHERIPLLGRAFKASENAFTGFQYRSRADIFDKLVEIAEKSGGDIQGMGKIANSLTGRGTFGQRAEAAASATNTLFFSPRFLKSNIDALTAHLFDSNISPAARKEAALNTVKIVMGVASILTIAKAFGAKVETDPRSSDFGKIRVGNTRFDVSGGMGSIVVLASRLISGSSKSSTTGLVTELNSGKFGSQSKMDVIYNFFENKLSPAAAMVKDFMKGEDFEGNEPTLQSSLANLFVPLPAQNAYETLKEPGAANILAVMIADGLGVGTSTYSATQNWEQSDSQTMKQFKAKVGEKRFKEANENFNARFAEWFESASGNPVYVKLSDDDRRKIIERKRDDLKRQVFNEYGFRYARPKKQKLPNV